MVLFRWREQLFSLYWKYAPVIFSSEMPKLLCFCIFRWHKFLADCGFHCYIIQTCMNNLTSKLFQKQKGVVVFMHHGINVILCTALDCMVVG